MFRKLQNFLLLTSCLLCRGEYPRVQAGGEIQGDQFTAGDPEAGAELSPKERGVRGHRQHDPGYPGGERG